MNNVSTEEPKEVISVRHLWAGYNDRAVLEDINLSVKDMIYLLLTSLIGFTVVMLMRVVGLIMVIAMLTIPAAISGQFVKDMKRMMALASLLGVIFTTVGLWLPGPHIRRDDHPGFRRGLRLEFDYHEVEDCRLQIADCE